MEFPKNGYEYYALPTRQSERKANALINSSNKAGEI